MAFSLREIQMSSCSASAASVAASALGAHVGVVVRSLLLVQLSNERARQAVRQGCSFAKRQKSPLRCWSSSEASVLDVHGPVSPDAKAGAALGRQRVFGSAFLGAGRAR
jgi:hypothetical protein